MGTGTAVSTGDVATAAKMNLKLETVSTGDIASGTEISTGYFVTPTISSGFSISGMYGVNFTTSPALAVSHVGTLLTTTTDGVIFSLPLGNGSTLLAGGEFLVKNWGTTGAALVVLKSGDTTAEMFYGAGNASGAGIYLLANTKATAVHGDYVKVRSTGSTSWYIIEQVGTWSSAT